MYTNAVYCKDWNGNLCSISVEINGQQLSVPLNPANTDYANITALVAAGELTIAPAGE